MSLSIGTTRFALASLSGLLCIWGFSFQHEFYMRRMPLIWFWQLRVLGGGWLWLFHPWDWIQLNFHTVELSTTVVIPLTYSHILNKYNSYRGSKFTRLPLHITLIAMKTLTLSYFLLFFQHLFKIRNMEEAFFTMCFNTFWILNLEWSRLGL